MLKISDKQYRWAAYGFLALVATLIVLTFRQYGVTWDEELQSQYGLAVVDYYLSFFQDHRFKEIFNLYLYGGMFDGMASAIDRFTPFSVYETRHLVNALVGLLGLWGVWRLGRLIGGGAVGLMAVVMLALTPMYYGHMFNNPKDIPFATGIIWTLYFMGRCFVAQPRVPRRLIIKLGIVLGLTLGVRVGGVMLPMFWCAVLGADVVREILCRKQGTILSPFAWARREGVEREGLDRLEQKFTSPPLTPSASGKGISRANLLQLFKIIIPVALISYAVMLICWPWAQLNPILNPLRALSEFSNFPQDVEVLLDGVTYRSTQLPWYYVPLYFSVQLPEFLLFAITVFAVTLPYVWKDMGWERQKLLVLMLLMGLFPVLFAMLRHPALYDAVRHFLFVAPIACVLGALSLHKAGLWAVQQFEMARSRCLIACGLTVATLIIVAAQITVMVRLHPYEYIFVNQFAGGVAGAYGRYELDYWGSSFKEAAARLQDFVAKEGGISQGKIYKIAICGPWSSAMIYLPPDYEAVIARAPAEFFLSTTRWDCPKMRPGKKIIEIDRMGVPLAVIKDLRDGFEHYPGNEDLK